MTMLKEYPQHVLLYSHRIGEYAVSMYKTPFTGMNTEYVCAIYIDNSDVMKNDIRFNDNDPEVVINFIRAVLNVLAFNDTKSMQCHVHFNEFVNETFKNIV